MNSYYRLLAVALLVLCGAVGYFDYISETKTDSVLYRPFQLGLDLSGGTHLVYEADTRDVADADKKEAMQSLRSVIERRVNIFGVSEPLVQIEQSGLGANAIHRLVVELPGITNIDEALKIIDKTPELDFRLEKNGGISQSDIDALSKLEQSGNATATVAFLNSWYLPSGLTGRLVESAEVVFDNSGQGVGGPQVLVKFNNDGASRLTKITTENIGKPLAIFLDGELKSAPVIQDSIANGQALITGDFSIDEAKTLVRDLNLGALPVPIKLISTQTIGATLGEVALAKGVKAGLYGFIILSLFMIFWYRLPGLISVFALTFYVLIMVAIFKLIPVTLSAAGIAGFILSIGVAVDANVLIFERLKEELRGGKRLSDSIKDGFIRAWLSIRDSNLSSLISAIILFWFGTSLIKGFALTLGLGVVVSMFTAIVVTRTWLLALGFEHKNRFLVFLFGNGLKR